MTRSGIAPRSGPEHPSAKPRSAGHRTRSLERRASSPEDERAEKVRQTTSFAPPARAGAGEWSRTTLISFTKRVRSRECYASLGSEGTSRTCNEQRVTTAPACHMPTSENGDGLVMPPPPTRRRPAAPSGESRHAAFWLSKSARHTRPVGHTCPVSVSELGVEPRLRDSESRVLPVGRFRNCCRSGGSRTRAARGKSPACRFNTSDREVGPEGVKPSPHRVKAGHAIAYTSIPISISFRFRFVFSLRFMTTHLEHRLTISGHTSPVERTRALHTPHVWARLELNQLVRRPGVYSAGRFPETIPEPLNDESRLGYPGGFTREKPFEIRPYVTFS